ncbi:mechanosensitive ion channel family protein [Methylobacterium gnaphalii]|uniref:Mechanosensitive ion channel MscS domain-containing protein n=1 Tax=Methylobacterium gnaphalii TaxID=1010610 RepID=A0A512JLN5_9HYPH|nr:mechanosensitive ion channel domain-containing protein [Methylobacterium gnaphalii]GEP10865.1 hypothetical protein MGN01_27100 [Methylobacterium gnaphalii]GJD70757.1 hypothetical protein MMMDOFMJ_3710 [Methylobacterium gnaphalii]GLS50689.1 hypothetical protein GCM10007885_35430 [Methylobacterium gnaphalii]
MHNALRLLLVLISVTFVSAPSFAGDPNWTGTWNTRWRQGGARMALQQEGSHVHGTYLSYDGSIAGEVQGRTLKGRWIQGERSGGIEFVLSDDGQSFMGRFDTGEWWTGGRTTGNPEALGIDQRGPRQALRTFVDAGNSARYDAPDQMTRAVSVIDFGENAGAITPEQKLGLAQTLFNLVDQTTFRLHGVPGRKTNKDAVDLKLEQAGTGAMLPLHLFKKGDKWFIAMPDEAALEAGRKALFARSGGRPPSPEAYKLRKSARDAMRSFTRAFSEWNTGGRAQALATLDTSELSEAVRNDQGVLALQYLNGIVNRIGQMAPQEISDDPQNREPLVVFSHPEGRIVIAPKGAGDAMSWKFTPETVRNARNLYIAVEEMPTSETKSLPAPPSVFFKVRKWVRGVAPPMLTEFGPLEAWQIAGWATIIVLAIGLGWLIARAILVFLLHAVGKADPRAARRAFRWPLWGTVVFLVYNALVPALGLPDLATRISVGVTGVMLAVSVMWLGWRLVDAVVARYFSSGEGGRMSMDNILVSLGFGALKIGLVAAGLTYIAIQLSLPYEGVVASLSIGGLAVAFASRETLSNVFGAGILAIDRPFRRGDWIATGDTKGTVEHVGIRSTRVRTADDSLIIVPNGKLSDATVNNLGTRRFHLNSAKLPIPYDTTVPQIEALVSGVKELVAEIPESTPERTSVAVSALSQDGIEVTLKYGLDVRNGANETEIVNHLMMNILRLCERLGIRGGGESPVAA